MLFGVSAASHYIAFVWGSRNVASLLLRNAPRCASWILCILLTNSALLCIFAQQNSFYHLSAERKGRYDVEAVFIDEHGRSRSESCQLGQLFLWLLPLPAPYFVQYLPILRPMLVQSRRLDEHGIGHAATTPQAQGRQQPIWTPSPRASISISPSSTASATASAIACAWGAMNIIGVVNNATKTSEICHLR